MTELTIVGRSSSHYTRTVRLFALQNEIAHRFQPVFDLTSLDAATYAGNPALKIPILVDEQGPLFGTENICRALASRSARRERVVLRGDVDCRVVANAEEMTLHAMSAEVSLIMAKAGGSAEPPKVRQSLENALAFLDEGVDAALVALPLGRSISFLEAALFSVVTHLPFRAIMDVTRYEKLLRFTSQFGERAAAKQTEYRYDAK